MQVTHDCMTIVTLDSAGHGQPAHPWSESLVQMASDSLQDKNENKQRDACRVWISRGYSNQLTYIRLLTHLHFKNLS